MSINDIVCSVFVLLAITILVVEIFHPFIDEMWRRILHTRSNVRDEDLADELDPAVIQTFLKEPTYEDRQALQEYLAKQELRQKREEAMLLDRLRA